MTTRVRVVFFFNDTATTEIYTLSLHDALPIYVHTLELSGHGDASVDERVLTAAGEGLDVIVATEHNQVADYTPALQRTQDRKSTRLNSSHANISYAAFCLKKKSEQKTAELQFH